MPKRALVTGGASGIGAAIVARFIADGMEVVALDRDVAALDELVASFGATGASVDLTDMNAVTKIIDTHGPFDVAVNNAGMDQHAFFTQTNYDDWRRLLAINLEAVFAVTHAVLPSMREAGYGRLVNVASEAGRLGSRGGAVYAAAKGGVIAFTRSIAREVADRGITANVVAPGPIDTPLLRIAADNGGERLLTAMVDATLARRLGTPDEVAGAVAYLASDEAGFVTGEVLGISGGMGCGA